MIISKDELHARKDFFVSLAREKCTRVLYEIAKANHYAAADKWVQLFSEQPPKTFDAWAIEDRDFNDFVDFVVAEALASSFLMAGGRQKHSGLSDKLVLANIFADGVHLQIAPPEVVPAHTDVEYGMSSEIIVAEEPASEPVEAPKRTRKNRKTADTE